MSLIRPFRGLRPAPGRAAEVLAPPYDVLSSQEARLRAKGRPYSFLHVSKAEIDLDPAVDPHDDAVYAKAAENFRRMRAEGVLTRDDKPAYYIYRLTAHGRSQTGLAAVASVAAYERGRIRKHELTTTAKEDDRVRQIEAVNAQTGPVLLAYPSAPALDDMLARAAAVSPDVDVVADDGVRHQLWIVDEPSAIDAFTHTADTLPALYICDGHHRSAAAARVAQARNETTSPELSSFEGSLRRPPQEERTDATLEQSHDYFLAVLFPHHQLTILDYNRVVRDLNGRTPEALLAALRDAFAVEPFDRPVRPAAANEFGLYLAARWHRLTLRPEFVPQNDPIGRLPITLLAHHILEPWFAIKDQRNDKRIDFIGGGRGLEELTRRVDSGEAAAAFSLYPTQMTDLMAVADRGGIMPPKSTWFEPKLADGLLSHVLD
ncbi:MAG TPA: DUF1015 family protein [Xanthobacteraceae bacterium]|nr:DUF1015 family protein [Xanthobacteraceae bacterium]